MTVPSRDMDVRWTSLAVRLAAGFAWMALAVLCVALGTADGADKLIAVRVVCAAGLAAPPMVWSFLLRRRLRRADELERMIVNEALGKGAINVLIWGALMAAFGLVYGLRPLTLPLLFAELPAMAMLTAEISAHLHRRRMERAG